MIYVAIVLGFVVGTAALYTVYRVGHAQGFREGVWSRPQ